MGGKMTTSDKPEAPEEQADEPIAEAVVRKSDAANWAKSVSTLKVGEVPADAININVEGRRVTGPMQGFGKLWQKTYRVDLGTAVTPKDLIAEWKQRFPEFWPPGNRFFGPLTGIAPGEVAVLNLKVPGRLKLSTGVLVIYADDESFTFMTPAGHGYAGFITFSSFELDGKTFAQVQPLFRANDPIYEIGMPIMMNRMEDKFWHQTLRNVGAHFGAEVEPEQQNVCVDKRRQWRNWKNVWHNAFIRSAIHAVGTPFRWIGRTVSGGDKNEEEVRSSGS
jgi:hypothetical protein